jgi:hypothetical protein
MVRIAAKKLANPAEATAATTCVPLKISNIAFTVQLMGH